MEIKEYGYEYDASKNDEAWNRLFGTHVKCTTDGTLLLRSGRDALKAVAREYRNAVVLLPALSCESMVSPFQMHGHTVRFYKLTKQYAVDLDDVERLIDKERIVLFLYIDYFGNLAITDSQLNFLRSQYAQLVFVEDRTHNLLSAATRNFEPEFMVASLRKWCNIPDGGILRSRVQLSETAFAKDSTFAETRLHAQCLRKLFFETGDLAIKTNYRHIFATVSDILDADQMPALMSAYSYALAESTDWREISNCRKANASVLMNVLKDCSQIGFIQKQPGCSDLYVAITVNNRDLLQQKLAQIGIFCTIIWPLSQAQTEACPVARHTYEHMLAVPCDQRYSQEDMLFIGREIVRLMNE